MKKNSKNLNELRQEIDGIDRKIVDLFGERLAVCREIAEYKSKNDMPIFDVSRENAVIEKVSSLADDGNKEATKHLYKAIFEISKDIQKDIIKETDRKENRENMKNIIDYKKIIRDFTDEHSFEVEAKEELLREFAKLEKCAPAFESFEKYVALYNEDKLEDFDEPRKLFRENFEEASGVHQYSWCMLFLICLTPHAHDLYMKAGVSEKVFFDSMADLLWKIRECKAVYGIWGTFVYSWYPRFFQADRFAFGRLQFETGEFSAVEYSCEAFSLKKGDPIIRIHIPGAGKLAKELCLESLAEAAEYYGKRFEGKPLVFTTHSWILTPYHYDFLKCCPNVLSFMDLFDIIGFDRDPNGSDLWRIFNIMGKLDLDKVPADTSMRRAYIEYLKNGGETGWGYGLIYWDKENKCPRRFLEFPIFKPTK